MVFFVVMNIFQIKTFLRDFHFSSISSYSTSIIFKWVPYGDLPYVETRVYSTFYTDEEHFKHMYNTCQNSLGHFQKILKSYSLMSISTITP